jgi:hypothetical protein
LILFGGKTSSKWIPKRFQKVLDKFPICSDGRRHHPKVDQKRNELMGRRLERSRSGKKGGLARVKNQAELQAQLKPTPTPTPTFASAAAADAKQTGPAAASAARAPDKKFLSEFCGELLSRHPHPQQPHKAEEELAKILSSAAPHLIRERHAAWCSYWTANPGKFVPHLWRWLADGDWKTSPPTERKPPAKSRKGQLIDDLFASLDAKKGSA